MPKFRVSESRPRATRGEGDALRDEILDATEQLQRRSPCRAFLLVIDEDAPTETAELTATTRKHGPLRDIVSVGTLAGLTVGAAVLLGPYVLRSPAWRARPSSGQGAMPVNASNLVA